MLGVPTHFRFSFSAAARSALGTSFSSTSWRMSPANFDLTRPTGALPGRKPGSLTFFWSSDTTRPVSSTTSATGTVISRECLQPSTSATICPLIPQGPYAFPHGRGSPAMNALHSVAPLDRRTHPLAVAPHLALGPLGPARQVLFLLRR